MRPEALYLTDILGAVEAIGRFVEGVCREEFLGDELRQSAVLQKPAAARAASSSAKRVAGPQDVAGLHGLERLLGLAYTNRVSGSKAEQLQGEELSLIRAWQGGEEAAQLLSVEAAVQR